MDQGKCDDLELEMEGEIFSMNVHLFMMEGVDVVLGISWLKSLMDMLINWEKWSMKFWKNGR